jgi:diacylglycerol kinase family enzyme
MKIAIIVNPSSGRAPRGSPAGAGRIELARQLTARAGPSSAIVVMPTMGPEHGTALAREYVASAYSRVIAWGGDGTINEVAGPLLGTGVVLGIVPAGSGDGLARGLGLPTTPDAALAAALADRVASIDVGMLGPRHFLNIGGISFDAVVAEAFNRRSPRGQRGYLIESLRRVWSYRSDVYTVETLGERFHGACFEVAFANCREYGSGLVLAPHGNPADGRLEMVRVSGGPAWRQLWRARRLTYRRLAPAEGVYRASVTSATVTGECLKCHVDGQTFEHRGAMAIGIKPQALVVAGVTTIP